MLLLQSCWAELHVLDYTFHRLNAGLYLDIPRAMNESLVIYIIIIFLQIEPVLNVHFSIEAVNRSLSFRVTESLRRNILTQ